MVNQRKIMIATELQADINELIEKANKLLEIAKENEIDFVAKLFVSIEIPQSLGVSQNT